jgi:Amt family ammonium transporter
MPLLFQTVISIQYFLFGFSLSYSNTSSFFIGNFDNALLRGVGIEPFAVAPAITGQMFMLFQCMFAAVTPIIIIGGGAERIRIWLVHRVSVLCAIQNVPIHTCRAHRPMTLFLVLWSTLCYDFFIAWMWGPVGWLKTMGELDFAGGTAVHVASGTAGLALGLFLGPRKNKYTYPASMKDVLFGTAIIWFGWFFFVSFKAFFE